MSGEWSSYGVIAVRVYSKARTSRVPAIVLKSPANLPGLLVMASLLVSILSACGNKGDLFLIPDSVTEQELQQLEQNLSGPDAVLNESSSIGPDGSSSEDDSDESEKSVNPDKKNAPSRN